MEHLIFDYKTTISIDGIVKPLTVSYVYSIKDQNINIERQYVSECGFTNYYALRALLSQLVSLVITEEKVKEKILASRL
jgi:hypothetical protein